MKTQNWKVSKLKIILKFKFGLGIDYSLGQLWKIVYLCDFGDFHS